tara:strand:+ start:2765 stop:3382 length:618 start_codon:yes stop_codon:yes gene_type:complete
MLLIKISKSGKITNIDKSDIEFIKKNRHITKLNKWDYNNYEYVLYGCENGDAGEENKYDLPPPVDCELYFNELYFIKYSKNKIIDLPVQEYEVFYSDCFGGFEDIQDTDDEVDESLSEHTSDKDFINDDENISIGSETHELDLEELSSFTSDEEYVNEENDSFEDEQDDVGDLSSIEITVSSCDEEDIENDIDDLDNIEDDIDTE